MANIDKELNKIKRAIYGKEVRGSIHDGIDKVNRESEGSRNIANSTSSKQNNLQAQFDNQIKNMESDNPSFAEVVQARGDEPLLKDRLNKTDQQLADTEDETFKSSLVNHKVGGFNVWWIDDDAQKGVYTKIAPLLREYGIKMSSAVITNRAHGFPIAGLPAYNPNGSWIPYNQMKELHEEGIVEFIPHSHTHNVNYKYRDMTNEEIHEDMSTNVRIMRKLGWNYRDIPYPFGSQDQRVRDIAKQYYRSGINTKGGTLTTPIDQSLLPRLGMDTRDTQDIIDEINVAYENDTLLILMSHVDQYGGLEEPKIRAVIEHVQSLGGDFITADEAIGNYGNFLQIGDNSISYKGEIHGSNLGVTKIGKDNEFLSNNLPKDFKVGVTINKIDQVTSGNTDGFPFGRYGNLITYKTSEKDYWTHQFFYGGYYGLQAKRQSLSPEKWTDWSIDYIGGFTNAINETIKPKDHPLGVSTVAINQPDAVSTPNLKGGILTTIKTENRHVWTYQEFVLVATGELYRRKAVSDENWGDWVNESSHSFIHKHLNYTANDSIESFEKGGYTSLKVRKDEAKEFGLPRIDGVVQYGSLITYRDNNEDLYSYQEFTNVRTGDKYFRSWDRQKIEWNSWIEK